MENQREKLVELIESQFGLLEKLLKVHAITRNQLEQLQCESTRVKINKMMLDYIFQGNKQVDLITALSESFQSHVVNWIKSEGEYIEEFGFDWPLTERQQETLDFNLEVLTDNIDNCELLSMLYAEQVINKRQKSVLHSKATDHERNEVLLGMVRRLSQRSFLTLINCLRKSNQKHIANILENSEATVSVHATVETDNLDETEEQIVDAMANLILQRNMLSEQVTHLLATAQQKIIAVNRGRSIVLHISCSNEDELNRLCKMIDNSEMKKFLEQLFNLIIHNTWIRIQSVKIFESDLAKTKEFFENNSPSLQPKFTVFPAKTRPFVPKVFAKGTSSSASVQKFNQDDITTTNFGSPSYVEFHKDAYLPEIESEAVWHGQPQEADLTMSQITHNGAYMLRESSEKGSQTLLVKLSSSVVKYRIQIDEKRRCSLLTCGPYFDTMASLVTYYKSNPVPRHDSPLTIPFSCAKKDNIN